MNKSSVYNLGIIVLVFFFINDVNSDIPEDARLNFTQLAVKYGRVCEEHDISTSDGYRLKVFRLPGNSSRPVLLMHGLFGTADDYILRGNTSLALALAAAGYDVWLGNYRGNRYSRSHAHLLPDDDAAFWNFGAHEHACYDLAATIDYVLDKTEQENLRYIGISEGSTIAFVLLSVKPEYNCKFNVFIALAPVVYLNSLPPPLLKILPYADLIGALLQKFKQNELFGFYSLSKAVIEQVCSGRPLGFRLCMNAMIFPVAGFNPPEYEAEFLPVLFGHMPGGTSRQNLLQFAHIAKSRTFGQIDYGAAKNVIVYGSTVAPKYNLSNVNVEIHMMTGRNDRLSRLADVALLKKKLKCQVYEHLMESPTFSHLDFTWGKEGHKIVARKTLQILEDYL